MLGKSFCDIVIKYHCIENPIFSKNNRTLTHIRSNIKHIHTCAAAATRNIS